MEIEAYTLEDGVVSELETEILQLHDRTRNRRQGRLIPQTRKRLADLLAELLPHLGVPEVERVLCHSINSAMSTWVRK